jgi:NAD(P)-dependent dehydrogenase (short-subunit alcohol dehydrogenase family)
MPVPDFTDRPLAALQSLSGRIALVTGAGRGIGRAIATRMAEAGADIVLAGLEEGELRSVAADIGARFSRYAWTVPVDLAKPEAAGACIAEAIRQAGRLDILVNNAGIFPAQGALDIADDDWDRVLAVNLRAAFVAAREFARHLAARKSPGAIVNIASVSAIKSAGNAAHYVASKHGMAGLTKSMAEEFGKSGIRVIALAPTLIETPGIEALIGTSPEIATEVRAYGKGLPLGRTGLPDDVARVAVFAASDLAGFVSGVVIPVDGGDLAR